MKKPLNILVLLLTLFSCGQTNNNPEAYKKDTFALVENHQAKQTDCNFEKFLNDPKTPKMAKELFNNTYELSGDDPLVLLENLDSKNDEKRKFYFKVIGNSKKISDGAYAEGLGFTGKEYIEKNTKEFASYFEDKECFTDKDLENWADIAILEFSIIAEEEYDKPIIDDYIKTIKSNCEYCSTNQQATINKFTKALKTKWQDYLKSQRITNDGR